MHLCTQFNIIWTSLKNSAMENQYNSGAIRRMNSVSGLLSVYGFTRGIWDRKRKRDAIKIPIKEVRDGQPCLAKCNKTREQLHRSAVRRSVIRVCLLRARWRKGIIFAWRRSLSRSLNRSSASRLASQRSHWTTRYLH